MPSKPTYEELGQRLEDLEDEILDLKRTQDGIRTLENAYRSLFETSRDGIAFVSLDGRIEDVNDSFCRMLGYNPDELRNLTCQDLTPKKWHVWEQEEIVEKQILRDGHSEEYEKEYIRRDGTVFPVSIRAWLIKDEQDAPAGMLELVRCITERSWVESESHESMRRFRELFDNMSSGVAIYEARGNGMDFLVLDCNSAGKRISKVKMDVIFGKSVLEVFPDIKEFGLFEVIRQVWKSGVSQSHPISLYQGDRLTHWVEYWFYKLPSGEIATVYNDITDRKQAEEKLLASHGELERQVEKRTADLAETNRRLVEEVEEHKQAEKRVERMNLLMKELILSAGLQEKLKRISQGVVDLFQADFCRIWLIQKGDFCGSGCFHAGVAAGPYVCRNRESCLHLYATSGRYTHVGGRFDRVPFGSYKIGRIASGEEVSFISNDVTNDPRIHDREWARRLDLVSFAGYRLLSPDGSPQGVLALFSKNVISSDQEALLKSLASLTSHVIQAARSAEAMKAGEKVYRDIFNSIIDGLAIVDLRGKIVDVNPALCRTYGYDREELIGLASAQLVHSGHLQTYEGFTQQTKTSGKFQGELVGVCKDGTTLDVEAHGIMIHLNGKLHLLEIKKDITSRRRVETELMKDEKLKSIGSLTGGMAHDYNNLLSVILSNLSLAKMDLQPEDDVWLLLDEAERASNRVKDLTNQLITFSKGETLITRTAPIGEFIKKFSNLALAGSNVACDCHIPKDLWSVWYDEVQMKQAIGNLITNAKEAMPEGGNITIRANNEIMSKEGQEFGVLLPSGKYVKISLQDQGFGISQENLTKIFDPYFSTKGKGAQKRRGTGLSTVDSIIKRHEGYITVESKPGAGSTFHIWFPSFDKDPYSKEEEKKKAKRAKGKVFLMDDEEMIRTTAQRIMDRLGLEAYSKVVKEKIKTVKGKVLLMDDEEMIRTTAQRLLDRLGFEAELARDGSEALKFYAEAMESGRPFDVVILDLTVRAGMGGKEAARKLREIDSEAKAIISSGYSGDPIMVDFRKFGFSEAITKPYELQRLGTVLKKVMDLE